MTDATDEPQPCPHCKRKLVTVKKLARAVHSGCALTGERHDLTECPNKRLFELDAEALWSHMDRQDNEPPNPGLTKG